MGSYHLDKLLKHPEVELTGIFDKDSGITKQKQSEFGVKTFSSVEELIFESDAVIISSPTPTHFSFGKLALDNGVHVFLEKPICQTTSQAAELVALAQQKDKILQTGFVERYRWRELQNKLPQEFSKKPAFIGTERSALSPSREKGLDVVSDLMIHDVDFVLSAIKEPPVSVVADGLSQGITEIDFVHARLEFPSGTVAHLKAQWGGSVQRRETHLIWLEKNLVHDLTHGKATLNVTNGGSSRESLVVELQETDPLSVQLAEFVKSAQGLQPPVVSGREGLRALEVCEEIKNKIRDRASDKVWISPRERKFLSKYWEDYAH